ncbi:MAG TPA: lactonase family protein [Candidatus Dormibacteraeota bacterium]|jgi:6-phosphogluconolactonase|nr:lactonase family protein [Candidatus Dormibacteraeota bacterium]
MAKSHTTALLVGTSTPAGRDGEGVLLTELDTERGVLRRVAAVTDLLNPSFLAFSPIGPAAYTTSVVDALGGRRTGALVSLTLRGTDPAVSGVVETGSTGPCHVAVAPDGRHAVVANYRGGAASVISLEPGGPVVERTDLVQHQGSGTDPDRQEGPHPHSATFDPTGERALVCDLGLDRVLFYRLDAEAGRLEPLPQLDVATPAGTGPRHLDFSPDGRHLYVAGELNSTLLVYAYDPATGETEQLQVADTLGGAAPGERNYPADVHVHPGGRFVYLSNRGLHAIAIFAIDERDGRVELVGNQPGGGVWPVNFAIHPEGRLLLCANQHSDNVVPFWIDPATGALAQADEAFAVRSPACLRFTPS